MHIAIRDMRYIKNTPMKKHKGMRPQDIVVLLKILSWPNDNWRLMDIAQAVKISQSEVSEALNRNAFAGLLDRSKRHINKKSFYEFLVSGLKYVFPVQPGQVVRGVKTAHSAPPVSKYMADSKDIYVWPSIYGNSRGQSIEPLYKTIPDAIQNDHNFYEYLALVDTLRVGKTREVNIAREELKKKLNV